MVPGNVQCSKFAWSVRCVDCNTRKPFLRRPDRVTAGITEAQADEIMDGYLERISSMAQVDEQGGIDWGTVSYRHTTEAREQHRCWGVDLSGLPRCAGRVPARLKSPLISGQPQRVTDRSPYGHVSVAEV